MCNESLHIMDYYVGSCIFASLWGPCLFLLGSCLCQVFNYSIFRHIGQMTVVDEIGQRFCDVGFMVCHSLVHLVVAAVKFLNFVRKWTTRLVDDFGVVCSELGLLSGCLVSDFSIDCKTLHLVRRKIPLKSEETSFWW